MNIRHSLIIPVYNNELNIPDLLLALRSLASHVPDMEVVFVVDGSPDHSWSLLNEALTEQPFPSQLVLLARNFGSFLATRCGLSKAQGEYMAVMAADLQEPPELVAEFFRRLGSGTCDVVVGNREKRDDPSMSRWMSRVYWRWYKRLVLPDIPAGGVDVFACNRKVRDALLHMREHNSSLVAQLFWLGFRRESVSYGRRKREKGKSAWTFRKKFTYMLDSVFAFSDLPIKMLMWLGLGGMGFCLALGLVTLIARIFRLITVPGYTALLLVMLFMFACLLFAQGIIGCYLWRCFENTKQRPLVLEQEARSFQGSGQGGAEAGRREETMLREQEPL